MQPWYEYIAHTRDNKSTNGQRELISNACRVMKFSHALDRRRLVGARISDSCLPLFESAIVPISVICLIAVKARVSYDVCLVENQPSVRNGREGGCDRRGRGVMTVMNKRMHVSNANSAPQLQECIIRR